MQTGREDFVEGCRPAIFVIDNPSFPYLDGERQATLLSKGVPGDIFYMPTKTKFRTEWQQDYIVDYKTGCWRLAAPVWDWF